MKLKKLLYISLLASSFAFVACDKSDNDELTPSDLSVVNVTGTLLKASGDSQSITLNQDVHTVYSSDSWLSVEKKGSTVEIKADANDSREKRNAIVVMKTNANDSTVVNVSQEGLIFGYEGDRVVVHSYKEAEAEAKITCNELERVKIISQPEWVDATLEGDIIKMKIAENKNGNTAGDMRVGYVKFAINENVDSVKVLQYYWTNLRGNNKWLLLGYPVQFYEDGSYEINQTNSSYLKGNLSFFGTQATFTFPEVKFFSNLPAVNLTLKATLSYEDLTFSFNNGQFMGNIGDSIYIAETTIGAGFMRTFSTAPVGKFVLDVDESGMLSGRITGEFPVDGGNLDIIGLWFCAFKRQEFSADAYYGQGRGDIWGLTPCWMIMPDIGN